VDHPPDERLNAPRRQLRRPGIVEETWQTDWHVRYRRQPLEAWCQEFADAGFLIEGLVEPRPADTMGDRYREERDRLERSPGFIAFRLVKP
jgi:hypothetical protein